MLTKIGQKFFGQSKAGISNASGTGSGQSKAGNLNASGKSNCPGALPFLQ